MRPETLLTSGFFAALALTAVGMLTGCSGSDEGKNYAVPKSFCGVSLNPDLIDELLPSGNKIGVQEKNPVPSLKRCQVNVDGKVALRVNQEWWQEGDTVVDVAQGVPQVKSAVLADDSDFLLTGTGAVQQARCTGSERPGRVLFITAQVYADGVDDSEAMQKLITAYTRAVEGSAVCR
ncbi:hypothetical protein [Streptomyces prasinopilosus]|uniref:DUF3558 domain-containing protein n=1 Tax=Streptomyces prasinopilosus TaxID=67344 RepID=A0A1G7AK17_9ACTN|nr:hypothetical protein [Streptomyces prasinopilosus]SDE14216.1 hypothetical protein SAMN05216505_11870 [Streptomyces prasinopilosus]